MATLREKIEAAIETSGEAGQAAIAVCVLLDEQIGLADYGWFDNDEVMLAALK